MRHAARLTLAFLATLGLALPAHAKVTGKTAADGAIVVEEDGKPVLTYRTRTPDPEKRWITHSVHPLFAPDGTMMTVDGAGDHLFHRGLWWSWRRILENGKTVADSWVMSDVVFDVRSASFHETPGGGGEVRTHVVWRQPSAGKALFEERTVIRIAPLSANTRRVEIDTELTGSRPNLAIAGSDDVKGYGGVSIRLPHHAALRFSSDGKAIEAKHPGYPTGDIPVIEAGETLAMTWDKAVLGAATPPWRVTLSGTADGAPIKTWIIRNSPSMQNLAWPGRAPAALPMDRPVKLKTVVTISPN